MSQREARRHQTDQGTAKVFPRTAFWSVSLLAIVVLLLFLLPALAPWPFGGLSADGVTGLRLSQLHNFFEVYALEHNGRLPETLEEHVGVSIAEELLCDGHGEPFVYEPRTGTDVDPGAPLVVSKARISWNHDGKGAYVLTRAGNVVWMAEDELNPWRSDARTPADSSDQE